MRLAADAYKHHAGVVVQTRAVRERSHIVHELSAEASRLNRMFRQTA